MNSAGTRAFAGQKCADIETPALLVDLDAMEQNLQTMARFFRGQSSSLRPHFKNHRVVELAREAPLRRFVVLSAEAPVLVAVDNAAVIKDIARLARERRTTASVLVDITWAS